jgi:hypothetical protein
MSKSSTLKLESWTWRCSLSCMAIAWCNAGLATHLKRRRTLHIAPASALCSWMRKEKIHHGSTLRSLHFPALFCKWNRRGSHKSLSLGRKTGCRRQMSFSKVRCVQMQWGHIGKGSLTVCRRRNALSQALRRTLLSPIYFFADALMPTRQTTTAYAGSLIRRKSQSETSPGSVRVSVLEDSS